MAAALERIEILGERLPIPLDTFRESRAGNVFDAFHQLDQPLLATFGHRGEPDTTGAVDDGAARDEYVGMASAHVHTLLPTHERAGASAGVGAVSTHDHTTDDRGDVSLGVLQQPPTLRRQIVNHAWRQQTQTIEVD